MHLHTGSGVRNYTQVDKQIDRQTDNRNSFKEHVEINEFRS